MKRFRRGGRVIFRKSKHSTVPGPRAKDIHPSPHGEDYAYYVEKFWTVAETRPGGEIVVQTRRGKRHVLRPDDPALRRATWWERLLFGNQFPTLSWAGGRSRPVADGT